MELIRCKDRLKTSQKLSQGFKVKKVRNPENSKDKILDKPERVTEPVERAAVPIMDPWTFDWQKSLGQNSLPL